MAGLICGTGVYACRVSNAEFLFSSSFSRDHSVDWFPCSVFCVLVWWCSYLFPRVLLNKQTLFRR